jgi:hypothetical protein
MAKRMLRHVPVTFALIVAVVGMVRNIRDAAWRPRDDAPVVVAKFSAIARQLPRNASVCYEPVPHDAPAVRLEGLARYALAPRPLSLLTNSDCRWITGPDYQVKQR